METILSIMKGLADRNRLRIIMALHSADELCACQITELLQVSGATVSKHLSVLQQAGLITSRKAGKFIYYRMTEATLKLPVMQWLNETLSDSLNIEKDSLALTEILRCDPEEICRKQRGEKCCPVPKKTFHKQL